jgi:hypothetical protein
MGRFQTHAFRRLTTVLAAAAASLTLIAVPFLGNLTASAQSGGQGLQVSPVIVDLNGEKGGSYTLKLTVTNVTAGTLDITSTVNDFTAADDTGNPKIITDTSAPATTYSLRSWVTAIPPMTLQPKQSRNLTVGVNIPHNAEAGGHYGVIRFSGVPPSAAGQTQVSLNASVGVLLLARVAGNITEKLVVKDMYAQQGSKKTGLISNGPVTIVTEVSNTGNVHVKPVGTMTIKDTFGKTVGSYPFGSNTKNVLPGSTRRYDQPFDKRFLFGRYTAHVEAGYGTTGGVLIGTMTFWVIPYKLILFLIVIIAVLVLLFKRLIKRYNQHIVHRSQQSKHKNH